MNAEEFDINVAQRRDSMYRLARSIVGDHDTALDITQDVLERLWVRRGRLETYANLSAVIYTSVRNRSLDELRRGKFRETGEMRLDRMPHTHRDERGDIINRDLSAIAGKLIDALPEKQKTVIHLRDIEGLEIKEIAEIMQSDEQAVRTSLSRARKTVRLQLIKIMDHENKPG